MVRNKSYGICKKCGHRTTKGHMLRHLRKCLAIESKREGHQFQLIQLRIEAEYLPMYWLDIEINADSKLRDLDKFLRDIWLECCGHMSQFQIADHHYLMPYDGSFEIWKNEGNMDSALSDVIRNDVDQFQYEYDFGTSTDLKIIVVEKREGQRLKKGMRLLSRNDMPDWQCTKCQKTATDICVYCLYEGNYAFCEEHRDGHGCDEEYFMPIVNSPRVGQCGYVGPDKEIEY
jgi:hypothetical protein